MVRSRCRREGRERGEEKSEVGLSDVTTPPPPLAAGTLLTSSPGDVNLKR